MNHLLLFENFSNIEQSCKEFGIKNYTLNDSGRMDVNDHVNLSEKNLSKLPFKFGRVSGDFVCSYNKLVSLSGSPQWVGGSFCCDHNELVSLDTCPEYVGQDFICEHNKLGNLTNCPHHVGGNFVCNDNDIKDIFGLSRIIMGNVSINNNPVYELLTLVSERARIHFMRKINLYEVIYGGTSVIKKYLEKAYYITTGRILKRINLNNY